jgi:hypothetical protein
MVSYYVVATVKDLLRLITKIRKTAVAHINIITAIGTAVLL